MRAILIDDEPLALNLLKHQIDRTSGVEVVETFTTFAIETHYNLLENIDVVFLDIEMPGINGLTLAEMVLEVNSSLSIIFVTAFNEYAVQAFELNALDYILKPVQLERLGKTIERIKVDRKQQSSESLELEGDLRVNVCRELGFESGIDEYVVVPWRTAKAQELFLYLLQHCGKTIRKSTLTDLLWPDFEQNKAYSQLYTAIYHMRQALSRFDDHFLIKNRPEGYILLVNNVSIDIVTWEKCIQSAPEVNIKTIDQYEATMSLYTGSYLAEYDYVWAEPERYRLKKLWIKTAYAIADCYLEHDKIENAEEWYSIICAFQPEDEMAHFSLMKIYASLDYGLLVTHQYEQLTNDLKELEMGVSPHIKKWFTSWNENILRS